MLYSFKLITPELEKQTPFYIQDGDRTLTYFAGKDRSEHYYCNLHLNNIPTIIFDGDHTIEELAWGTEEYFTPYQSKLNENLIQEQGLKYAIVVHGDPQRAVVTFPQYAGDFGPIAPYPLFRAERFGFDNTLYISFQDPYFSHGSYMLSDNYGNDVLPLVEETIRK